MLNKDLIKKVRDAIAAEEPVNSISRFNMNTFGDGWIDPTETDGHFCATPACIAGYISVVAKKPYNHRNEHFMAMEFGLDDYASYALCFANGTDIDDVTKEHAIEMLDWLLTLNDAPDDGEIEDKWNEVVNTY